MKNDGKNWWFLRVHENASNFTAICKNIMKNWWILIKHQNQLKFNVILQKFNNKFENIWIIVNFLTKKICVLSYNNHWKKYQNFSAIFSLFLIQK